MDASGMDPSDPRMRSDRQGPSGRFLNLPFMRKKNHKVRELHLPLIGYLPNRVRNHITAMIGESVKIPDERMYELSSDMKSLQIHRNIPLPLHGFRYNPGCQRIVIGLGRSR
jgi:hypothetical protein